MLNVISTHARNYSCRQLCGFYACNSTELFKNVITKFRAFEFMTLIAGHKDLLVMKVRHVYQSCNGGCKGLATDV